MFAYPDHLEQAPIADLWHAIPELNNEVDPFDARHRMAVYKLLIDGTNQKGIFGKCNEFNCFWGYAFQMHWQWRSGRYKLDAETPKYYIEPDSIWSYSNYSLSIIPMIAAVQVGLLPFINLIPPRSATKVEFARSDAQTQTYTVPAVFEKALAEWRALFEAIKQAPPGADIEPIRFQLWHAHGLCLKATADGDKILGTRYSRMELDFLSGWVRMVDFLASAAWRTDLEYMTTNGLNVLPERLLKDSDIPGQVPDMNAEVNSNLKSMFALVRLPEWRFNINLLMWKRAMRTRSARDNVLDMLAATFHPTQENRKERMQLLGYVLKP